jgi:hypothetical protein
MAKLSQLLGLCFLLWALPVLSQPSISSGIKPVVVAATLRERVVVTAQKEVGVVEVGYNRGPKVNIYLASSGNRPGEYWCSAFITWVYKQNGIKTPAGAGAARSYFQPGPKLLFQRNKLGDLDLGRPGDVVGFYYPNLGRIGHIGMIEKTGSGAFITIEGNTGEDGGRNGDGVHRKRRMKRSIYALANHIGA